MYFFCKPVHLHFRRPSMIIESLQAFLDILLVEETRRCMGTERAPNSYLSPNSNYLITDELIISHDDK